MCDRPDGELDGRRRFSISSPIVSDRVADVVADSVDCVVRGGEPTTPSLVARRMAELHLGVYASPDYLKRHGTPTHPDSRAETNHRIVGFLWQRIGSVLSLGMRRGDERIEVRGRYVLAVDDGNAYLAAGLAGLGVLWLPRYIADAHAARGELIELFADWRCESMPLYVLYPPNRHVSAKLRVFIDWLVELMAQLPRHRGRLPSANSRNDVAAHPVSRNT